MEGSKLSDLNLSNDEIGRLEKAFSNNKFRDLFAQYLKEMQDPEKQKIFENEIIELEKQRGNDVLLIKPTPHHVLKTSVDGKIKAYINFACCSSVNQINYVPAQEESTSSFSVSIPYSLSPARKTHDKSNRSCNVYSVVFHPTTLDYADKNDAVKKAVQETAFSAIENTLNVRLDKVNVRTSKKQSKGTLEMTMVKRNSAAELNGDTSAMSGVQHEESDSYTRDDYVTPTYKMKYRNEIDLQNSTTDRYCRMDILVPKQVIIEINLPLLKSIQDTKLDVRSTSIELTNQDPKYKLQLTLPYEVNENSGSAKFNADSRVLTLHLDVMKKDTQTEKRTRLIEEVCNNSTAISSNDTSVPSNNLGAVDKNEIAFLATKVKYRLPRYVCNHYKNTLAFTLKVKNVVPSSFEYLVFEKANGFWVKFYSLGSGQFPMYYSMRIAFAESFLTTTKALDYEIEDHNVFLYVNLIEGSQPLEYTVGVDANCVEKAYLNEVEALKLKFKNEKPNKLDVKLEVTEINTDNVVMNMRLQDCVTHPEGQKKSPPVKEELLFDSKKLTNMEFAEFCNQFQTQFTLDEESTSLSESELVVQGGTIRNETLQINSDAENESWITQNMGTRKLRRKKKARDKNSLIEESIVEDGVAEIIEGANESAEEGRDCNASQPIDIRSAYRYSDLSGRSILKKNRSFSESSGDECFCVDYSRSYSVDEMNFSSDSYSQSGPKKSVTFNNVVLKKLFCSDISILEQLKRQKRHSRRKARRASDSENSETESGEAAASERRENVRAYNETLLTETGSETDLTSSLSESGGETSDDQGESLEGSEGNDVQRPPKKQQPVPSSKKGHKRRGKKSARKIASTAKHRYHNDAFA